jgi:hypothetical protein
MHDSKPTPTRGQRGADPQRVDGRPASMTASDLLADLARLLREGLVRIDQTFEADVDRFQITRSGQGYLAETTDDEGPSRSDLGDRSAFETTQRGVR